MKTQQQNNLWEIYKETYIFTQIPASLCSSVLLQNVVISQSMKPTTLVGNIKDNTGALV